MELLPIIANYFGVTIDRLLSNDVTSKEADIKQFYENLNNFEHGSLEKIQYIEKYCHRYPNDDKFAFILQDTIKNHLLMNKEKTPLYLPTMIKLYERLKGTCFHEGVVGNIICVCPEEDLEQWLNLCSWTTEYTSRGCLVSRYNTQGDNNNYLLHQSIESFENFATQLDCRFPDAFGPTRKAKYQKGVLKVLASFGDGITPPDGWAPFFAYKQFVLAACLFGDNKPEEGWKEFDAALTTYRRIFSLEDEWLSLGNAIFSGLKLRKDCSAVLDSNGNEHRIYGAFYVNFYHARFVYDFLTNTGWAWFDIIRDTPKYQEAVKWAKEEAEKEASRKN